MPTISTAIAPTLRPPGEPRPELPFQTPAYGECDGCLGYRFIVQVTGRRLKPAPHYLEPRGLCGTCTS